MLIAICDAKTLKGRTDTSINTIAICDAKMLKGRTDTSINRENTNSTDVNTTNSFKKMIH